MLDPQIHALLQRAAEAGAPDLADLDPILGRQVFRQILAAGDLPAADVTVQERAVPASAGPIRLRLYRPHQAAARPPGIALYIHGGGFALGDLDGYDSVCRTLCAASGSLVASVDYRLAPEHPFPAAVEDCWAALNWLATHAAELGADGARIAVCGDSAGGNLAAVLALLARESGPAIALQVLGYPVLSAAPGDLPSHERLATGYVLSRRAMEHFSRLYFGAAGRAPDFRGAPLLAGDLHGAAPALILVGGYDVLHDDGVRYAHALIEAGVPATLVEYPGLSHGFLSMAAFVPGGRLALEQVAAALRLALA